MAQEAARSAYTHARTHVHIEYIRGYIHRKAYTHTQRQNLRGRRSGRTAGPTRPPPPHTHTTTHTAGPPPPRWRMCVQV